jgi:hypothetical protein
VPTVLAASPANREADAVSRAIARVTTVAPSLDIRGTGTTTAGIPGQPGSAGDRDRRLECADIARQLLSYSDASIVQFAAQARDSERRGGRAMECMEADCNLGDLRAHWAPASGPPWNLVLAEGILRGRLTVTRVPAAGNVTAASPATREADAIPGGPGDIASWTATAHAISDMACGAFDGDALPMLLPRGGPGGDEQLLTGLTPAQILGALHYLAITRHGTRAPLVVMSGTQAVGVLMLRRAAAGANMYWHLCGGHTLLT